MTMNHDIFISYSSVDKIAANAICHVLEQNKLRCWIAPRDIPPGAEYGDLIDEAIKHADIVVIIFSETSSTSSWVKGELNIAFEEQKTIIPFRLDSTPLKGQNRLILAQKHWIDAYPDYETKFVDLVNAVKLALGISTKDGEVIDESGSYKGGEDKTVGKPDKPKWYKLLFKPFDVYNNGVPKACKKWNFAAFLFPFVWGPFNGMPYLILIFLLMFLFPLLSIPISVLLGIYGNGWAWKSKNWASQEEFIEMQNRWSKVSLIIFFLIVLIFIFH
ncbi:MAG: toll/interleukin-1 receptor domain-containing protein [Bacteroidales bacterium]|nr:toll/interleukin-1 receptor domain-containing protein [Bacteroidales bacterium]